MLPNAYVHYHHVCPEVRIHDAGITVFHSHTKELMDRSVEIAGGRDAMKRIYTQCVSTLFTYIEILDLKDWEIIALRQEIETDYAALRILNRMK